MTDKGIVHVSFDGSSAEQARRVADVTALAYIDYRAAQADDRLASVVAALDERLGSVRDALGEIDPETGNWIKRATRIGLLQELEDLSTQRAGFAQVDTTGGSVISSAADNPVSLSPNPLIVLIAGLLAGGVIGVIVAFSLRAGSRRWGSASDVQRSTRAPVLGRLVSTTALAPEVGDSLEELRAVRERILSRLRPGARVLLVVDNTPEGAGNDLPVNLGLVLAQSGRPVDLVLPGSDLAGAAHLDERLHASFPDATSDAFAVHVRDTLGADTADNLLILALPSTAPRSSVLAGLRLSDAAVLVGTLNSSTTADAVWLRDSAAEFDTELLGTVLVPRGRELSPLSVPTTPAKRPAVKRTPRPKAPAAP